MADPMTPERPRCGAPCLRHAHACDRSPRHTGFHRDVQQKGEHTCEWDSPSPKDFPAVVAALRTARAELAETTHVLEVTGEKLTAMRGQRDQAETERDDARDAEAVALPDLRHRQHVVETEHVADGTLFEIPATDLREERQELRRTIGERCAAAAELLTGADHGIAWCQLNDEGDRLTREIDGAVQVKGSDPVDAKEEALTAFTRGEIRVLVTKPTIAGWGLNWQHCHRMTFFPSHSYEQYYQAVRRCWRFGQQHPVTVDIVTTEGGSRALANLQRKATQADRMFDALVTHMRDAAGLARTTDYPLNVEVPSWAS